MLCLRPLGAKSTSLGFLLAFVEEYQRQRADWAEVGDKARSWRRKRYAQNKLVWSVVTPLPKNFCPDQRTMILSQIPLHWHHLSRSKHLNWLCKLLYKLLLLYSNALTAFWSGEAKQALKINCLPLLLAILNYLFISPEAILSYLPFKNLT